MAGYGPPKTSDARSHKRKIAAVQLPAEGRTGDAPAWPLRTSISSLWADLWALPQAVEWERGHHFLFVARYAQLLEIAEQPGASASLLNEVRQMEDRLGLTPVAMHRLNWKVVEQDEPAPRAARPADAARKRLRIVGDGRTEESR